MERRIFCRILIILVPCLMVLCSKPFAQITGGDNNMLYNKSAPSSNSSLFLNAIPDLNVELYTGKLQVSLPLFALSSSELNIPISLSYDGGAGIKVEEGNTTVGLGWTLNGGGSISRMVRGIPDESAYGYIGSYNLANLVATNYNNPNGIISVNGTFYKFNNVANNIAQVPGGHPIDGEPDIFYIQTPFFSTRFTFDVSGNPVFPNNSMGLKVVDNLFNNAANALTTSFVVSDEQGNQYYFGSSSTSRENTTTKFFSTSFNYVSTWYLDKIVTFNSKDVINFYYQQGSDLTTTSYQLSENYTSTFNASNNYWSSPATTIPTADNITGNTARNAFINTITINAPKYLLKIVSKLGEADFAYTNNSSPDINAANPPALSSISLIQIDPKTTIGNVVLRTLTLNYADLEDGIVNYTPPLPAQLLVERYRRILSNITVTGNTAATSSPLTMYTLKYNQSAQFPETALPQNCDYWGYANSSTFLSDGSTQDANYYSYPDIYRQPNLSLTSLLVLNEIDYLSGETAIVNYELNTYFNGTANVNVGGLRVSGISHSLATGEILTNTYLYNDSNNISTGQVYSDLYKRVTVYFGTTCCNLTALTFSQSPYSLTDDHDIVVGYSSVTVKEPNGGFTVTKFSNFSDFPDVISFPSEKVANLTNGSKISSFSYKRGLPQITRVYTSAGIKLLETINSYSALDAQPTQTEFRIQDATWFFDVSHYAVPVNTYNSNLENYRLVRITKREYDQVTPANYRETAIIYVYAPNKRRFRSITNTDSKGQSNSQTFYYADDSGIPMVTSPEQTALNAMVILNAGNVLIHEVDSRNGVIHQVHNTYGAFPVGSATNFYLTNSTSYSVSTIMKQVFYNYDLGTSNLISSNEAAGKSTATTYGYNNAYPVATIVNSSSTSAASQQQAQAGSYINTPGGATFTSAVTGNITIGLNFSSYPGSNNLTNASYSLTGPSNSSGGLCFTMAGSGSSCGTTSSSVVLNNMPAGPYSITGSASTNVPGSNPNITYQYSALVTVVANTNEFFFEGFEMNPGSTNGNSHTGNAYWNGNYTVAWSPPNGRTYLIQWWNLSGGKWIFNQQTYAANMILTGPIDDIRVFPTDALMTTFTYSPLVGKTSETDPSGISKIYEYDGLGRILRIRDQDNNILKQFDYQYNSVIQ
jgi:YD repeat-containing protein